MNKRERKAAICREEDRRRLAGCSRTYTVQEEVKVRVEIPIDIVMTDCPPDLNPREHAENVVKRFLWILNDCDDGRSVSGNLCGALRYLQSPQQMEEEAIRALADEFRTRCPNLARFARSVAELKYEKHKHRRPYGGIRVHPLVWDGEVTSVQWSPEQTKPKKS